MATVGHWVSVVSDLSKFAGGSMRHELGTVVEVLEGFLETPPNWSADWLAKTRQYFITGTRPNLVACVSKLALDHANILTRVGVEALAVDASSPEAVKRKAARAAALED